VSTRTDHRQRILGKEPLVATNGWTGDGGRGLSVKIFWSRRYRETYSVQILKAHAIDDLSRSAVQQQQLHIFCQTEKQEWKWGR